MMTESGRTLSGGRNLQLVIMSGANRKNRNAKNPHSALLFPFISVIIKSIKMSKRIKMDCFIFGR